MEMKCCICGKETYGYGCNAEPIRKGFCCEECNTRFVLQARILNWKGTFEIIKNPNELKNVEKKLEERDFEQMSEFKNLKRFQNVETEENVILCVL